MRIKTQPSKDYHVYICIYMFVYTYINIYMYTYVYICTYIYVYMCIYMHIQMFIFTYIYMYICTYLYVYICINFMYIHIYIHIRTRKDHKLNKGKFGLRSWLLEVLFLVVPISRKSIVMSSFMSQKIVSQTFFTEHSTWNFFFIKESV